MLFGWLPSTPNKCTTAGGCPAPLQGIGIYLLLFGTVGLIGAVGIHFKLNNDFEDGLITELVRSLFDDQASTAGVDENEQPEDFTEEAAVAEPSLNDGADESEPEQEAVSDSETAPVEGVGYSLDDEYLDRMDDLHQETVAPSGIRPQYGKIKSGQKWRKAMFADTWPDEVPDAVFKRLFTKPDLSFDLSIHIKPRDRKRALRKAESRAESLQADAEIFGENTNEFAAGDKKEEARKTANVRDQIKNGQRPSDVTLYTSVRGDSEEVLQSQSEAIRKVMGDAPANIGLKTVRGKQLCTLESIAPVAKDVLADEPEMDPSQVILGEGVGAILGSATKSTLIDDTGVEMGEHAFNGSPIIKDPFESETNYNWVVIGDSGSGKSYDTKLNAARTVAKKEDTMLIILDPLEGFVGVSKALGAERITIGGSRGLNPLEIRQPPEHLQESAAADQDPLSSKIKDVMSFFDNFAHNQGLELGAARTQLNSAVKEAYTERGITHDVETHGKESPTILDVVDILEDMADNPGEYTVRTDEEIETVREHATTLISYLRPFVDGQYENLARPSEFDLRGEDVVYLDLSQQEGSGGGSGLMMQLMFSLVYERAKETEKNVIFAIDEARYLMREAKSLEFLGQRVRHSRHYDTSIRFITQNIRDFFDHEEAESIINNSFIKVLHRTEEIEDWQDTFDLNDAQVGFVKGARTGEGGYSEALVEIDSQWYPMQVYSLEGENAVVDFDERNDSRRDLPGVQQQGRSVYLSELQRRLEEDSQEQHIIDSGGPPILALPDDEEDIELEDGYEELLDLLNNDEIEAVLDDVRGGADPEATIEEAAKQRLKSVEEVIAEDCRVTNEC
ncbi:VirB4 family type IV secretion system protein [Halorussus sp. AFM4]|uniref:VirB4 family type IV secretion system protein n=1 Tax=Halorussus sp. AFM4 TaxID=3421651 RepID=UPI003EB70AE8